MIEVEKVLDDGMKRDKRHQRRIILSSVLFGATLVFAVFMWLGGGKLIQRQALAINDWWKERSYQPSEKTAALKNDLALTQRGARIFAASDPAIAEEVDFNQHCSTREVDGYILGCYLNDAKKIYIYQVEEPELAGIEEATAAHELLHAVWERLSEKERAELEQEMRTFMDARPEDFAEMTELYEEGDWMDELHSRIAVEFAEIPEKLEEHYRNYFTDRGKIVGYYQNYKGVYEGVQAAADSLQAEIDDLRQQIDVLKEQISKERENYQTRLEQYKKDVTEYNSCVREKKDCYSLAEATAEANRLNGEGGNVNYLREVVNGKVREHNQKIEELNQKVDAYNQNALHLKKLNNTMNSQVESIE